MLVAVGVVDALEAVEVDEHDRGLRAAVRPGEGLVEGRVVAEPGERVGGGALAQRAHQVGGAQARRGVGGEQLEELDVLDRDRPLGAAGEQEDAAGPALRDKRDGDERADAGWPGGGRGRRGSVSTAGMDDEPASAASPARVGQGCESARRRGVAPRRVPSGPMVAAGVAASGRMLPAAGVAACAAPSGPMVAAGVAACAAPSGPMAARQVVRRARRRAVRTRRVSRRSAGGRRSDGRGGRRGVRGAERSNGRGGRRGERGADRSNGRGGRRGERGAERSDGRGRCRGVRSAQRSDGRGGRGVAAGVGHGPDQRGRLEPHEVDGGREDRARDRGRVLERGQVAACGAEPLRVGLAAAARRARRSGGQVAAAPRADPSERRRSAAANRTSLSTPMTRRRADREARSPTCGARRLARAARILGRRPSSTSAVTPRADGARGGETPLARAGPPCRLARTAAATALEPDARQQARIRREVVGRPSRQTAPTPSLHPPVPPPESVYP